MKVLIIGAGETGFYIAHELSEDGHYEVTLVDEQQEHIENLTRSLNVAGIVGNGTNLSVLEDAGIATADMVVACTDHDETNLICCLLANHYKVEHKIAVTRTDSFLKRKKIQRYLSSGISQIINSSVVAAQEIIATANLASAADVSVFGDRKVLLVGYKVKEDSPWKGLFLKDLPRQEVRQYMVASIVRKGESFIPTGESRIKVGDYVYLIIAKKDTTQLNDILNVKISGHRRAVIVGGGYIAQRVALGLIHSHYQVTMVCNDKLNYHEVGKKFASKKGLSLVYGDASLVKTQLQLDVATSALFVSCTPLDHFNISCGMIAKYLGAGKTICLVNRQDLLEPAQMVNIDAVVSPRLSTARQVKKVLQGGELNMNYTTISETDMEVREMVVSEGSAMVGVPLKELSLPPQSLVGALVSKKSAVCIPDGETVFHPEDRVIMVTVPDSAPLLLALFSPAE